MEGHWVFTLHKPSLIPFLQYSSKRDLREKIFKAYIHRADNGNEQDNKAVLSRIAALRVRRANLLGYKTHADYVLEENMAKTPGRRSSGSSTSSGRRPWRWPKRKPRSSRPWPTRKAASSRSSPGTGGITPRS